METTEEKLEVIEQVLQSLVGMIKTFVEHKPELPKIVIPDHSEEINKLAAQIEASDKNKDYLAMKQAIDSHTALMDKFPKEVKSKLQLVFDIQTKFKMAGIILLFFIMAISVGLTTYLLIRNSDLSGEAERYKVVRAFYAQDAKSIDRAYLKDYDHLMRDADLKIKEQQSMSEAAYKEQEAQRDLDAAKAEKEALEKKRKSPKKD